MAAVEPQEDFQPNPPPPSRALDPAIAKHTFLRLKWALFQPLSDIQVLDFTEVGDPLWSPLFPAGPGQQMHAIASQPATEVDPPLARMRVVLGPVDEWEYWFDADAEDQRPAPLTIQGRDGGPVTIGQFVAEFHAYTTSMQDLVREVMGLGPGDEDMQCFFGGCSGPPAIKVTDNADENEIVFSVSLVESGMEDMEAWWAKMVELARSGQNA